MIENASKVKLSESYVENSINSNTTMMLDQDDSDSENEKFRFVLTNNFIISSINLMV